MRWSIVIRLGPANPLTSGGAILFSGRTSIRRLPPSWLVGGMRRGGRRLLFRQLMKRGTTGYPVKEILGRLQVNNPHHHLNEGRKDHEIYLCQTLAFRQPTDLPVPAAVRKQVAGCEAAAALPLEDCAG